MRRESLLERIDKLKATMPWYILGYYQLQRVPYFANLIRISQRHDCFFTVLDLVSRMLLKLLRFLSVLENMTKKDMEAFILYLRERPPLIQPATVPLDNHQPTLSALSSLYKYLTEEVENEQGEPYFIEM